MANRFKDYRAQLKSNKTVVLSDDELKLYSRTANNEGVSHANVDWGDCVVFIDTNKRNEATDEDVPEVPDNSDKEKTIIRNMEREQKTKVIYLLKDSIPKTIPKILFSLIQSYKSKFSLTSFLKNVL